MKSFFLSILLVGFCLPLFSQTLVYPEKEISSAWYEQHLRFLASDELRGRHVGAPGNQIAAKYIAEQFRYYGLDTLSGAKEYFQYMTFASIKAAQGGILSVGDQTFNFGENLIWLSGQTIKGQKEAIWVGNGWVDEEQGIDDYKGKDVKGKVVVLASGFPGAKGPREVLKSTFKKRKIAQEKGALGLIEVYRERFPWPLFSQRYRGERFVQLPESSLPFVPSQLAHAYLHDPDHVIENALLEGKTTIVEFSGNPKNGREEIVWVPNVGGLITGSDPKLRDEYVILTAHFDHVGVGAQGGAVTPTDSIFNGARDNGMGVVALLGAAKALATRPPKRSVICLAVNAEEIGLVGSAYYADHPLIPLDKTIFNLNSDGGGYNDTSAVTIMGMDRVGAKAEMAAACKAFNLNYIVDPAPEQNLFDRSDNVSFARKGVPAPTFSPGMKDFDQEIFKYYHQVIDEVEDLDWNYLHRFARAYAHAARLIADKKERPRWKEGDKYEPAAKALYGE